eukprot:CAMPEP_0115734540 /NCGR_PEP_ID=MMETSP0272-20121206/86244_1 /TAXON_ID=71861 /ORGANISM="Scrippsiella trochoidea, Strain CCMP3099" /LENGTH=90 /DNA_ID=CAMNT_0003178593 /DNA_START=415 /DNA_END=687 /DNA_ORIENTATION=+
MKEQPSKKGISRNLRPAHAGAPAAPVQRRLRDLSGPRVQNVSDCVCSLLHCQPQTTRHGCGNGAPNRPNARRSAAGPQLSQDLSGASTAL